MKKVLSVLALITMSACSTMTPAPKQLSTFDQKINCTPKSLIYLDQTIQKDKRSVTEKIKAFQRYRSFVKTKLGLAQSCYVKEAAKYKDIDYNYNVCMVVELNEESNISFLEIEDNANPLPASVSKCLYDIFEIMDYKNVRGPGVFSHSFRFQTESLKK